MKKSLILLSALALASLAACGGTPESSASTPASSNSSAAPTTSESAPASSAEPTSEPASTPAPGSDESSGEGSKGSKGGESGESQEGSEGSKAGESVEESSEAQPVLLSVKFSITVANVGPRTLYVAGNFTSWADNKIELTAEPNDVYSFTYSAEAGTTIEYKYIASLDDTLDWNSLNDSEANRSFTFAEGVETQMDGTYTLSVISEDTVTATFTLEALDIDDNLAYFMAGDLNGWGPNLDYKLTLTGSVYVLSLTRNAGTTISFKFIIASSDGRASNPAPVWESDIGNRSYTFDASNTSYVAKWNTAA